MSDWVKTRVEYFAELPAHEILCHAKLNRGSTQMAKLTSSVCELFEQLQKAISKKLEELTQIRSCLQDNHEIIETIAKLEAVSTIPLIHAAVLAEKGRMFESLSSAITQLAHKSVLKKPGEKKQSMIDSAKVSKFVDEAILQGYNRLLRAESSVLKNKIVSVLSELGYDVSSAKRQKDSIVLRGVSKEGTAIFVQMKPKEGCVIVDMAGFGGNSCSGEQTRFLKSLRNNGVGLKIVAAHRHGKRGGGVLVKQVMPLFTETSKEERRRSLKMFVHRNILQGRRDL